MAKLINELVADLEQQVRDLDARVRALEQRLEPSRALKIIEKAGAAIASKKKVNAE